MWLLANAVQHVSSHYNAGHAWGDHGHGSRGADASITGSPHAQLRHAREKLLNSEQGERLGDRSASINVLYENMVFWQRTGNRTRSRLRGLGRGRKKVRRRE